MREGEQKGRVHWIQHFLLEFCFPTKFAEKRPNPMHFKTITKLLHLPNVVVIGTTDNDENNLHLIAQLSDKYEPPVCSGYGAVNMSVDSNILITGPTGAGKNYLPCALAQQSCRDGHTTVYRRLSKLHQDITIARLDGRYCKITPSLFKCEVLILNDLLISPLSLDDQRELLKIIEESYDGKTTIVTSQLPIKAWHDAMQDKTLADAILDQLVHNAHKLELKGESMRLKKTTLDPKTESVTE